MRATGGILGEIVRDTRLRVNADQALVPLPTLAERCRLLPRQDPARFRRALQQPRLTVIAEVKQASPSKGLIAADFPYLAIARDYEAGGAAAISVLTEPHFFRGSDRYLEEIAGAAHVPVLRKDFVVDGYQLYQARALGAAAVLLIAAVLDDDELAAYTELARELGLGTLVEAHTAAEADRAVACGADAVGLNNRDLTTFQVDLGTSLRLRDRLPTGTAAVSESGISSRAETVRLAAAGFDAVLVGETLMRSADRRAAIGALLP